MSCLSEATVVPHVPQPHCGIKGSTGQHGGIIVELDCIDLANMPGETTNDVPAGDVPKED